jgi:hypothetical protein
VTASKRFGLCPTYLVTPFGVIRHHNGVIVHHSAWYLFEGDGGAKRRRIPARPIVSEVMVRDRPVPVLATLPRDQLRIAIRWLGLVKAVTGQPPDLIGIWLSFESN